MANENILRSYLMSIGFKIDEEGYRKFKRSQEDVEKGSKNLATSLEKFGTIAAASAGVLATSVVKITERLSALYYSSELANSSAQNLNAFKSAAEQIGISAEQAQSTVMGLAGALRTMPGLAGILKAMNINPDQDKVQVLIQLIDKLHTLPYAQAVQYAKLFGIDEPTLKLMEDHREELGRLFAKYQELNKGTNQQTEQARRFHQALQDLETRFSKLWDIIATRFMPVGEVFLKWLSKGIDLLIEADKATDGWSSRIVGVVSAITSVIGSVKGLSTLLRVLGIGGGEAGGAAVGAGEAGAAGVGGTLASGTSIAGGVIGSGIAAYYLKKYWWPNFTAQGEDREKLHLHRLQLLRQQGRLSKEDEPMLAALERGEHPLATTKEKIDKKLSGVSDLVDNAALKYGLDQNLFRSLIFQESRGNKNATSKAGAFGLAQLMPNTAKALGVNIKDPGQNVEGGAHFFSDLLKRYGGSESLALAAYNAGPGAVDKYKGIPPYAETKDYVARILQYRLAEAGGGSKTVMVNQNPKVDIHVNGARDPKTVADSVLDGQKRVNSQMQRDGQGVIR